MSRRPTIDESDKPRLSSKVFKAHSKDGETVKFKIGPDSKIILQKSFKNIFAATDDLKKLRSRFAKSSKSSLQRRRLMGKARNKFMMVANSDSVELLRERLQQEPQVKLLDKISFTLGVLILCFSEYIVIKDAEWFPAYYQSLMCILIAMRTYFYFKSKAQFFLIDFCYAVNVSCILQSRYSPNDVRWFRSNFACTLGPLLAAIPLWRNSLVFHSLDKMTSFFMHGFPPILMFLYRFGMISTNESATIKSLDILKILPDLLVAYLIWQVFYVFTTEILFRSDFEQDPELITSLRHLARGGKNPMKEFLAGMLRNIGVLHSKEQLNPDETKTKVVFIFAQFIYSFATMILCPWLFESIQLCAGYLFFIFLIGTWNGASYYIDVFSKTYQRQFEQRTGTSKLATKRPSTANVAASNCMDIETAIKELNIGSSLTVDMLEKLETVLKEHERERRRSKRASTRKQA